MKAGKLRQTVTIRRPLDDTSTVSDEVPEYGDVATRPAEVRPVTVKEIFAAGGFLGQDDVMVTLRYEPLFAGLNNTWQLTFNGKTLYVLGCMNVDMRDRWLKVSGKWQPPDAGYTPVPPVMPEVIF